MVRKIKKGLILPIIGTPKSEAIQEKSVTHLAIVGDDYWWMKPTMLVKVGDKVKKGQTLFTCKRCDELNFTAPVSGEVVEINRGEKRVFESLVLKIEGNDQINFTNYKGNNLEQYSSEDVKKLLLESGEWIGLKSRPYSYVARPTDKPSSIFVTAIDTNPLAFNPQIVIKERLEQFNLGLSVLARLIDGPVHVCTNNEFDLALNLNEKIKHHRFAGPHPAGNVGTHIHFIDPVSEKKSVWHIGYQEVIAYGHLLQTGQIDASRVISLAGPMAREPKLIKTIYGASISDLVADEFYPFGEIRTVSGSVFNGRKAHGPKGFLGRYHYQISLLKEGYEREFLGWHAPGLNKFSIKPIFVSRLFPSKFFAFNTNTNGSERSLVPIGSFEKVMPLDIVATHLLKALLSKDTERAQQLGALELDEEDLALCTFVDPCKHEFGPILRENLETIMKEG
jgi:Na+-transporting NADH:ubiquinone oxidoreductase subunit A